jgi:hypothetical protein
MFKKLSISILVALATISFAQCQTSSGDVSGHHGFMKATSDIFEPTYVYLSDDEKAAHNAVVKAFYHSLSDDELLRLGADSFLDYAYSAIEAVGYKKGVSEIKAFYHCCGFVPMESILDWDKHLRSIHSHVSLLQVGDVVLFKSGMYCVVVEEPEDPGWGHYDTLVRMCVGPLKKGVKNYQVPRTIIPLKDAYFIQTFMDNTLPEWQSK